MKLSDISKALSAALEQDCSCSLSVQRHEFSCQNTANSQTVVFLANLSYTILPGVDVPSLLTSWIISDPAITVNFIQLQVNTTCPVVITFLKSESCSVYVAPPTDPPTDSDVTVIAAATAVIVLLVVVTIIVAIAIAVAVLCKKQSKYRYVPIPLHHSCTWLLSVVGLHLMYLVCTVVVYSSVLWSLLAVQAQPSPPQPGVRV